jgi:hypothetical protein|tara:strand:+ start:1570 stop:1776 length:207 start_codon:yes stop_codon:yes gene_type:complete
MDENDRQLVAHMTATLLAGEQKMTIKQAVHNAAQILECVDARIHNAAAKKMFTPTEEPSVNPFDSEEE